jgi:hypothetical protein
MEEPLTVVKTGFCGVISAEAAPACKTTLAARRTLRGAGAARRNSSLKPLALPLICRARCSQEASCPDAPAARDDAAIGPLRIASALFNRNSGVERTPVFDPCAVNEPPLAFRLRLFPTSGAAARVHLRRKDQ